jgi:hypothetical protein
MGLRRFLIFFVLIGSCCLKAESVFLLNDSPYALTAIVQGADGSLLGEVTIQAGEQNTLTVGDNRTQLNTPSTPRASITPFYVIWKCPYGGYYSICSSITPGAMARASGGDGDRTCQPKPKKKENKNKGDTSNDDNISCDCLAK